MRLLSALSLTLLLSATAADAQTIRILNHAHHTPMYKEMADRFMAAHPGIKIELQPAQGSYEAILQNILRGELVGDNPDIVFQGYNLVRQTAEWGIGVPIDGFIAKEQNWSGQGFLPQLDEICKWGGKTWGLPTASSTPVVFFNRDLIRKAGLNADKLPGKWEDITALASQVGKLGKQISPIWFSYDSAGNWLFKALVESQGGHMMNADESRITFNGPEGVYAFKVLQMIGKAGFVDMSREQARQAFATGTMAVIVETSSWVGELEKQVNGSFDLAVEPFPVLAENGRLPAGGNCGVIISKTPEKQKAAWEFVKYFAGPEGQTILVHNTGYHANNMVAITSPQYLATYYKEHPTHMTAIRQIERLGASYTFPGKNAIRISKVIDGYMQRVLTLKVTPEDAMAAMTKEVQALLADK